ncbi:unnamed protein product [Parnassius apollo]|uniref:(apollo) hypothetical protein n=1 Tax=Parnassius apollo TaxID=110799 RepID=A0A8S3XB18_PARAO|nr:unnamed protein product [Parnassius apollo]
MMFGLPEDADDSEDGYEAEDPDTNLNLTRVFEDEDLFEHQGSSASGPGLVPSPIPGTSLDENWENVSPNIERFERQSEDSPIRGPIRRRRVLSSESSSSSENESQSETSADDVEVESVQGTTGGRVELPCEVSPALSADKVGLVIWYKQGHETPIYSPEDSGQYRCRVDFIKSPTKNTRLNLTVLSSEGNDKVHGNILGPYDKGAEVNLTCIAVGGRPIARVSWWKSHALLANSEALATVSFKLHRPDFSTDITCQAVTDPSIPPLSNRLSIDMNLPPLSVRIQGGKRPLVAGQSTELTCQVVGARPKPVISWWKGGTKLTTVWDSTSMDRDITTSVLTFVPAIEDAGRVLPCRAAKPKISHTTREDGWKMEIQRKYLNKFITRFFLY